MAAASTLLVDRDLVLRACAAVYGAALAIALLPRLKSSAPSDQLPGAMAAAGIDARASFAFIAALIVLPVLSALAMPAAIRRLVDDRARAWAVVTAAVALLASLWIALIDPSIVWAGLPPLLVAVGAAVLAGHEARFSRRDAILLPTTLSVFLALFDLLPDLVFDRHLVLAVILVLVVRIALTRFAGRGLPPALCFAFSPLALALQSHFNGYEQRHSGWPVLLVALGTPFAMRLLVRDGERSRRRIAIAIACLVYPIATVMYASATSPLAAEGKPHADLFENAHNLTTASEMLRGELPYRDIVPAHGLIQDGLLDFVIMRSGERDAGRVLELRGVLGSLTAIATYAVAACLTGSPELGLLSHFLAVALGSATASVRVLPALAAMAVLALAVRRRRPSLFAAAGVLTVLAGLTSLDFGAYTVVALLFALWRVRSRVAIVAAAAGLGGAAVLLAMILAAFGIFDDFIRVTFVEIPRLGPVYTLPPEPSSVSLESRRFFPDVLGAFVDRDGFLYAVWAACLLALAVAIARGRMGEPWTRMRAVREARLVLLVWIVAAAISYGERHHLYFHFLVPPVLVATAWLLVRTRAMFGRIAAAAIVLASLIAAQPTHDLLVLSMLRRARGPMSPDLVEVAKVPRAAGALFRQRDAEVVGIANDYVRSTLAADQTFFDFTNRGALYFLLDRDVPIRYVETAFYESEERQREVIGRIAANPKVRLALVPSSSDAGNVVDGVPNEVRAPLVWQYLRANFRPAFEQNGVAFWQRAN